MSCKTNWFLHQDQCRWEVRESVDQVQNNWYPCWTLSYSHLWLYRDWPCLSLVTYIILRHIVHCSVNFTMWTKYTTIGIHQRPARFSFLENSREFFFIFTSRSRSRAVSISLSLLEKEWRDFIFHFSLLEKSKSYPYFTLFSREKESEIRCGL